MAKRASPVLAGRVWEVARLLAHQGELTASQLADRLGVAPSLVNRALKAAGGVVERTDASARWDRKHRLTAAGWAWFRRGPGRETETQRN